MPEFFKAASFLRFGSAWSLGFRALLVGSSPGPNRKSDPLKDRARGHTGALRPKWITWTKLPVWTPFGLGSVDSQGAWSGITILSQGSTIFAIPYEKRSKKMSSIWFFAFYDSAWCCHWSCQVLWSCLSQRPKSQTSRAQTAQRQ